MVGTVEQPELVQASARANERYLSVRPGPLTLEDWLGLGGCRMERRRATDFHGDRARSDSRGGIARRDDAARYEHCQHRKGSVFQITDESLHSFPHLYSLIWFIRINEYSFLRATFMTF